MGTLLITCVELASLRHLRELRADGNRICCLEGIEKLDGLVKVSLEGNSIEVVELERCEW
jgi:hypothetical protein